MIALLGAMLAVLGTWALLGAALCGIGLLWRAIANPSSRGLPLRGEDFLLSFWTGFALVLMFLQLWHLTRPINGVALAVVLIVGIPLFALHLPRFERPSRRGAIVVLALVALWLANRAIGPGDAHDSGLYHYRAIRWANTYPIVPGIGNLSAPLGQNNVSFLYAAMLETGPWRGRSNHLANGLPLLVLFAAIIAAGARIRRGTWRNLAADAYLLALLPVAVYLALGKDVPSPKTDLPVGLMTFVVTYVALRLLSEDDDRRFRVLTLALLCAAAICLKFSSIVVVTFVGVVALFAWLRRERPGGREVVATLAGIIAVAALLLGPWLARNVIMSGYPLYPSKFAAVDVEWKVPEPAVDYHAGSIPYQAKVKLIIWAYEQLNATPLRPYAQLMKPPFADGDKVGGLEWVRPWFFSLPVTSAIEVVLPACITIGAWLLLLRRGFGVARQARALPIPMLGGVAFWLWAAPEPRYVWQTMWALAAVSVALAAMRTEDSLAPRTLRRCVWLAIILCLPGVAFRMGVSALARDRNPLREIPFQPPGPDHGFHPKPTQTWQLIRTRWGTEIYVPLTEVESLSWDGPLPATSWPPLDMDLRLRRKGDLSSGFVTDRDEQ